jgi:hypothetical protein
MTLDRDGIGRVRTLIAFSAALVVGILCEGCLLWAGTNRAAVSKFPEVVDTSPKVTPRLKMVLYHSHQMDGVMSGGTAMGLSHDSFRRALENIRPTMPFLAKASVDEVEPEFILAIDTAVNEHGRTNAFISGATLLIYPWFIHSDIIVGATLKTIEGEKLISHESSSELSRGRRQLHVSIRYTRFEVTTEIIGSEFLRQREGRIHENALIWLSRLEERIRQALGSIALLAPPT